MPVGLGAVCLQGEACVCVPRAQELPLHPAGRSQPVPARVEAAGQGCFQRTLQRMFSDAGAAASRAWATALGDEPSERPLQSPHLACLKVQRVAFVAGIAVPSVWSVR